MPFKSIEDRNAYDKKYYKQYYSDPKNRERNRTNQLRRYYANREAEKLKRRECLEYVKALVIRMYSDGKCACQICGKTALDLLTVDHTFGGGTKDRADKNRGSGWYGYILKQPKRDDLRVLCMECNWLSYHRGLDHTQWENPPTASDIIKSYRSKRNWYKPRPGDDAGRRFYHERIINNAKTT